MLLETGAARSLEIVHFGLQYCVASLRLRRAANGDMEMDAQATKLQAAENDLKQLMADVTRAMEKAQEAVARITSNAAATAETESTISPRSSAHA
jgi:peptidoglycan hydrolase CwlO-like protein